MEFAFLIALFFVISLIQKAVQKNKAKSPEPARRRVPPGSAPAPSERPQSVRDLFAEVRRQMEEAQRQAEPEYDGPVLEADVLDDIEERESLEVEPIVRSLEIEPVRPERVLVDYDAQAGATIRRRIKWAEDRATGRKADEHKAFDERIRRPKPKRKIVRTRARELRQMIVWQEVLGRPIALRDEASRFDPPV